MVAPLLGAADVTGAPLVALVEGRGRVVETAGGQRNGGRPELWR